MSKKNVFPIEDNFLCITSQKTLNYFTLWNPLEADILCITTNKNINNVCCRKPNRKRK